MYIYKIYFSTDVDYKHTNKLISELETLFLNNGINLDGFTIIKTNGYYKENALDGIGEIEKSYILEYIVNENSYFLMTDDYIKRISKLIKGYYNQKEVLTTKQLTNIL